MNEIMRTKRQKARPTIGLLAYNLDRKQPMWFGAIDAVRKRDANLICFAGGVLPLPGAPAVGASAIYSLLNVEHVDGLVTWAGEGVAVTQHLNQEGVKDFLSRYDPLPIVNYEGAIEGIPSILTDTRPGMREVLAHLIEVHGCRRIALIQGPEDHFETQERLQAYTETLAEYDMPLDPNLISQPGGFGEDQGVEGMNLLLDERELRPKVDFDAVAGTESEFALGAMMALQAHGIHVPDDVAVIGFNDYLEDRAFTPPLTTVRKPFYEAGQKAVELLFDLFEGRPVPETVNLPAELMVRRSCGCLAPAVMQAAAGPVTGTGESFDAVLAAQGEEIISAMEQAVEASSMGVAPGWAKQLLDAFAAEVRGESPGTLLLALDRVLRQVVAAGADVSVWHGAFSTLRHRTQSYLAGNDEALSRANDLWEQAQVMIGGTARRVQLHRGLRTEQTSAALRQISDDLATATTTEVLMDVLTEGLPRLGIPSCYLSLYEQGSEPVERDSHLTGYLEPVPEWSRLVLAYDGNERVELESGGRRFRSCQLVPDGTLPQERCYTMIAQALYFRKNSLGFVLFEVGPRENWIYHALRGQISSALQGVLLLREHQQAREALEKAYAEVENKVEERTAELQHEVAERERAQAESLRLQEEVIEAQRQALQELSTPVIPIVERIIVMPLIGSIDSMRARDITRALLAGIREHRAKVVILDITGVPVVDSGVVSHLNKTIQAARLKGAHTIVTGISDAVAETIVDLGIDWSGIETLADLQTGLVVALSSLGIKLTR